MSSLSIIMNQSGSDTAFINSETDTACSTYDYVNENNGVYFYKNRYTGQTEEFEYKLPSIYSDHKRIVYY
ncbi:hypothetical protein [Epinotia aporema granulovirus]|uniref:Uncharacterized protein n=1 Tax=Epinotia aporema granulovirus TaxID=166056 RepID=K4EQ36_9BBAC|nr:hypothetical protein [Epinotia aporema granulovirus]AER41552.1 hypothetical protein [Epinotia aporema granulovirus]